VSRWTIISGTARLAWHCVRTARLRFVADGALWPALPLPAAAGGEEQSGKTASGSWKEKRVQCRERERRFLRRGGGGGLDALRLSDPGSLVSGSSSMASSPPDGFGLRGSLTGVPPPPPLRRRLRQNLGGLPSPCRCTLSSARSSATEITLRPPPSDFNNRPEPRVSVAPSD
jgi:hypothetical protein